MIKTLHIGILMAMVLLMAVGCEKDEIGPGKGDSFRSGYFNVFARGVNDGTATRADGDSGESSPTGTVKAEQNELIHNWVVFFIKRGDNADAGTIELAASSDDCKTEIDGIDYSFKVSVDDGTYDIVGFGNMTFETVKSLMGIEDTSVTDYQKFEGKTVSFASIKKQTYKIVNNSLTVGKDLIPMSGFREDVKIEGNNEQGEGFQPAEDYHQHGNKNVIELIRMVAKVEISIKNDSNGDITLTGVDFQKLNSADVTLFPTYGNLGNKQNPAGVNPGVSSTTEDALALEPKITIGKGTTQSVCFYVKESSMPDDNHFEIRIEYSAQTTTTDESGNTSTSTSDKQSFWVPTTNTQWINRNDWIKIPIVVSDYTVDWEVLFYPPIGGYPAVVTDEDNNKQFKYKCTFKTQGDFEIRGTLLGPGLKPVYATYVDDFANATKYPCYTVTVHENKITETDIVVKEEDNNNSIFKIKPRVTATGEILGTLNKNVGHAKVPVTLTIMQSPGGTKIVREKVIEIYRTE